MSASTARSGGEVPAGGNKPIYNHVRSLHVELSPHSSPLTLASRRQGIHRP